MAFNLPFMALGTVNALFLLHQRMINSVGLWDDELADMDRVGTVTILMPTLNEADLVERALASLRDQNVLVAYPDRFEIVVVDSDSTDGTAEIAKRLADKVITAPLGKLTSIDTALQEIKSDIIIAVDGDSFYNVNFANLLLRHFEDPKVVGVSGVELYEGSLPAIWSLVNENYFFSVKPRLMGRGSAYRRAAYFSTGGFNLDIDQKDLGQMVLEEEFGFWNRLSAIGKCLRETRASVITAPRRLGCSGCAYDEDAPHCVFCEQVHAGERF